MAAISTDLAAGFDFIVVGAGTAGCLLANRLSARADRRVLLIEAGGRDNYHWVHIPVGYLYCIGNPRTDWLYQTMADAGLNGRQLRYPRGKVLGGCSSINGMIYMRGQARDYDGWAAQTGDDTWRWEHCLPFFKQHEDHWGGGDASHGAGAEWRVERQRLSWRILDAFAEAAVEAGIPPTDDFNRGSNEGIGYFEVNQKRGVRWNTSKAFLRPVLKRPNLRVLTGMQASRLLIERGRVVGVELQAAAGGAAVSVRASREVVLCAGAVGTPQLLQLSGIGEPALLQTHGIAAVHALAGVGENLQDHLQIRAVFRVDGVSTLNTRVNSLWGKAAIALEYAWRRSGPMSMAPSQLGAFTRSSPAQRWPNLQYHVQPLSLDAFGQPLHRFNAFTASVCNLNPGSRGYVRIASPRPQDAPLIQARYLSTDEDRLVAAESLRLTRRIAAMPALTRYRPQEVRPGVQYQSDADLARLAGDIGTTIFHPVGTCRMGRTGEAGAVVDTRLKLQGLAGLRIADASVMPSITSGNTNAPTLMIAERAAAWMLAEHAR
ncbi:MAG: GMC family oxidoreductase N-terminal domain-containing protein [Rubrivivax sp.]|nr:GMC family oxidoreductase N-terminal domain-containing protein [Rubrivivax sp.]